MRDEFFGVDYSNKICMKFLRYIKIRRNSYCVLFLYLIQYLNIGDWSNGMTEVSKTFSGSSILSSPVIKP